jgi:hypothetical protein
MQRFIAGLLFLLISGLISGHATAGTIGTVVAASGTINATGPGGSRALGAGAQLFEHDRIIVVSGNAQIELLDGTKLVVGPNSALILERFLMKGGATAQSVSVDALRGTFRFITGRSPKSAYNIQTSNATIAIRGTGFDFWVAGRTGVALLQGNIRLCSKGRGHSCVNLQPNCSVGVAGRGSHAHQILGREKASEIRRRLPYIASQSGLRSNFHLNTGSCKIEIVLRSANKEIVLRSANQVHRAIVRVDPPRRMANARPIAEMATATADQAMEPATRAMDTGDCAFGEVRFFERQKMVLVRVRA